MTTIDDVRKKCWEECVHCFATSAIFEKRANNLRAWIRGLTLMGIIVPLSVGAGVLSFGANSQIAIVILGVAAALGFCQALLSGVSLVYRWDDDFAYALESMSANRSLYQRFRELASNPPADLEQAKSQFKLIEVENNARSSLDEKYAITDKEKRRGMCAALRQMQLACAGCKKVPASMAPTSCDVCGNF